MSRRGSRTRRSALEWGVRGALAVATAGVAYVSITHTLAYTIRSGDPIRAHGLAPYDGRVTAILATSLAGPNASPADRRKADQLARMALRQDPMAVAAMSTLGIDSQIRGGTAAAKRQFGYVQKLSRRDLQTQIWAIEDAVARGDVPDALEHYDIALRTSRNAADLLFPVLTSAISDPIIRASLAERLIRRPGWGEPLIDYMAANGTDARSTARLFMKLRQVGVPVPESARTAVVNALIAGGWPADAWYYYASFHPGVTSDTSRDPRFTLNPASPAPFDWVVVNDSGITASIQRGDDGGIFDFAAPSSVGGPLLRQMQMLPLGEYRLEGHGTGIDQPASSRPYWTLVCGDGKELGRIDVVTSTPDNVGFAGNFRVPAGCPVQMLTFVARPSDAVSGLSGQIDRVRLVPVR